jgi:hypothetical protein
MTTHLDPQSDNSEPPKKKMTTKKKKNANNLVNQITLIIGMICNPRHDLLDAVVLSEERMCRLHGAKHF